MIVSTKVGPVTIFRMGKHVALQGWTLYETHAFLLGDVMIDTGTAWVEKEWRAIFPEISCAAVINTHHHEDHTGNNRLFQDAFGAAVYAHPQTLPFLEDPRRIGMQLYRKVVWKQPAASRGRTLPESIPAGGHTLRVIPAPGHCPDHVCLYEPQNGWLFSGDIFCGKRFDYLRKDEDFSRILDSLKKLAGLDVRIIFCGFKGAVADGTTTSSGKSFPPPDPEPSKKPHFQEHSQYNRENQGQEAGEQCDKVPEPQRVRPPVADSGTVPVVELSGAHPLVQGIPKQPHCAAHHDNNYQRTEDFHKSEPVVF